jgi:hypothetical protein
MIQKEYGRYWATCDICGESPQEEGFDDFQSAVDYKEREGWKSRKIDGVWEDVCSNCQKK